MSGVRTINEVRVVAAFPQLHHGVEEVGDTGSSTSSSSSCSSFGQEREILFQNGSVVFLLDVCQLHLIKRINITWYMCTQCDQRLSVQTVVCLLKENRENIFRFLRALG